MAKRNQAILRQKFSEVFHNPPEITKSTARKFGPERARKQKVAIAMSKARRAGAHIPKR